MALFRNFGDMTFAEARAEVEDVMAERRRQYDRIYGDKLQLKQLVNQWAGVITILIS